jgi:hypothetical protein
MKQVFRGITRDERFETSNPRPGSPGIARSSRGNRPAQQPQQTGMPFIMTQQVQPAFIMAVQQSQQA